MRSIDTIPRDEETKAKVLDIINRQFDLEILLKHREVRAIRKEINAAESTLRDLQTAIEREIHAANSPHYTRRSAAVQNPFAIYQEQQQQLLFQQHQNQQRRSVQPARSHGLYGRRSDGVFVRLSCPACKRDDFANQQGFLNHCRLAHDLEFGPYEQIMLRCGTPVDESEVPPDHPARLRPVTKPVPIQPPVKKERPRIKVFEEDVDLEINWAKDVEEAAGRNREGTKASKSLPKHQEQEQGKEETTTEEARAELSEETEQKSPQEEGEARPEQQQQQPQVESFAAAVLSAPEAEGGSRFYIKRKIIVGNVSKFVPPEKRDPTLKNYSHKWMVYVVEPPQAQGVAEFITGVRFYLHPSYKPHDVVDVTEPPFRLTRLGWGEFPIRMQLFFVDNRRNKSIDIIHQIKLDHTHSGKQVLGSEREIEIELDRNTDFKDVSSKPTASPPPAVIAAATGPSAAPAKMETPPAVMAAKQKMTLLNSMLKGAIHRLPIVGSSKILPYTCARNAKQFYSWSVGKRKAVEWHRAHLVRLWIQAEAKETADPILQAAATALTTKDVVLWCRVNGHVPKRVDIDAEPEKGDEKLYCRFCGGRLAEDENAAEHCSRRPATWSSKKKGVSSVSSVSDLLRTLPPQWDEPKEEEMDIDVDVTSGPVERSERTENILENIREWINSGNLESSDEAHIDWIWSVVKQLRLKGVVATDMVTGKDGVLKGPTADFDLYTACDQRLVVGTLLAKVTRSFLKRVLDASVNVLREQSATDTTSGSSSSSSSSRALVPLHVYEAIQRIDELDFLTNKYMGPHRMEE